MVAQLQRALLQRDHNWRRCSVQKVRPLRVQQFWNVSYSRQKTETACSSETLETAYRYLTARWHNPEDHNLNYHHPKILKLDTRILKTEMYFSSFYHPNYVSLFFTYLFINVLVSSLLYFLLPLLYLPSPFAIFQLMVRCCNRNRYKIANAGKQIPESSCNTG
jgi:hypothetical protein